MELNYSTHPLVTSNLSKAEGGQFTKGWELRSIPWDLDSLTTMVRTQSYIPSKLKDGYKVKQNVQEVFFLALDFDKGTPTLEEFKELSKQFKFSCFIHTSISHGKAKVDQKTNEVIPAKDRYRAIIPFSTPTDLATMIEIKKVITARFPTVDTTCMDTNRYFMMNPDALTYIYNYYGDNPLEDSEPVFMDPGELTKSKKQAKSGRPKKNESSDDDAADESDSDAESADNSKNSKRKPKQKDTFELNDYITLWDKTQRQARDIQGKEKIFCPFCIHDAAHRSNPDSANAFIDFNNSGSLFIYCSSEDKTYWQTATRPNDRKNKMFFNVTVGKPSYLEDDTGSFYAFKNDDDYLNYCMNNNINPKIKPHLPRVDIIFDPKLPGGLSEKYYNIFTESEPMKKDWTSYERLSKEKLPEFLATKCPIIFAIFKNIFGEEEYITGFINWMAYILQKREKAYTAWLITSETQGVGKDLTFERILKPLFGEKQCQLLDGGRIAKDFNKQDLNCFLRGFNEVFTVGDIRGNIKRREWLKMAITGPTQTIEMKGFDAYEAKNYMNFILFSNSKHAIYLEKEDRRFNVVRNDEAKKIVHLPWYKSKQHLEESIANELDNFAQAVFTYEYDVEAANTAMTSKAKDALIEISTEEYEDFTKALETRDADYFLLDEVFPLTATEKMLQLTHSDLSEDAKLCEEYIVDKGVIPAKYMAKLVKYHFARANYKQALKRLKLKGIVAKTVRLKDEIIKAYILTDVDSDEVKEVEVEDVD